MIQDYILHSCLVYCSFLIVHSRGSAFDGHYDQCHRIFVGGQNSRMITFACSPSPVRGI